MLRLRNRPIPAGLTMEEYTTLHNRLVAERPAYQATFVLRNDPEPRDFAWIPPASVTRDAYSATRLVSQEDLNQEADDMKHCVWGYGPSLAEGRSQIWHVQGSNRKDRATAQFTRTAGSRGAPGSWAVHQCYGPCNTIPSAELRRFVDGPLTEFVCTAPYSKLKEESTDESEAGQAHPRDHALERGEPYRGDAVL
jgi:hypothetical protein